MDTSTLVLMIVTLVFNVPMTIFSIVLLTGRGASLLAGFNTMSRAEQARWNQKAMCRFMGAALLIFMVLISASLFLTGRMWLFWLTFGAAMAELIGAVIYLNKSKRFKR